ncbi:alpha/beta fold hydrolase [Tomitella gaofuii]|uniref:alpha/beta fold hydrolase n=1 Tax=Tomitella gaofuii TaxID=2760083 RepID=UPI001F254B3A|nr:alpha/beta fold hydrolase [Tomitella gaofuii]
MALRITGAEGRRSAVRSLVDASARLASARLLPGGTSRTDAARLAARRAAMDALLADPAEDPRVLAVTADDGNPVHVVERGPADGVPIVFIHGWACNNRMWNAQVNELSREHRVVCYDQRGHGRTPSGAAPASMDTLADDLAAVLRATVSPDAPAVIVGHSMGGMTVNAWASRHPEQVSAHGRAAMLISTAADRILHDFGVLPFPERLPGAFALGRAAMGAPFSAALLPEWGFHYVTMGGYATAAQVAFCREIVNACPARNRGRWGTAMSDLDVRAGLESLTVPTTVIVGTDDRLTPPVHTRRMAEVLRESGRLERLVELAGVGHMVPVEAPFEVDAEIRRLAAL